MFIRIRLAPLRVRTVGCFRAPDPWNGQRVTDFNLDAYKMAPKGARRDVANWGAKELYGIRSEIDGAERILPDALGVLCMEGRVPREAVPRLLFEMGPEIKKHDFAPLWRTKVHVWILCFFGAIGAACLVMAALQLALSASAAGHEVVRPALAEWLARPQVDGESIVTDGAVKLGGSVDVSFTPTPVPQLSVYPNDGRFRLAWFEAQAERRLLLMPTTMPVVGGEANVTGVTLRPAAIGLPEAAVAQLRARVPNLNAELVTCQSFTWQDAYAGGSLGFAFWLVMAAISVIGGGIPFLLIAARKARRRRQMAWLLTRL